MTSKEMYLTLHMRSSHDRTKQRLKKGVRDMKSHTDTGILFFVSHNCPSLYCSGDSCSDCWEKAVETFLEGDNKPCI
jgi:hypothetical protein